MKNLVRLTFVALMAVFLGGCPFGGGSSIEPALKQLPAETQVLLAKKGMKEEDPILVRIFKEESQLEIWKEKDDGRYYHFKTYPICTWSGDLGPKLQEGDKQSPEGFYTVTAGQMNPNSQFHLAFNLGYPNDYDRVNGRTGSALMVHGDCRSAGCFAMTDALIEEIYALAREAFRGGQTRFHVHAFPFRMTKANMKRHRKSKWYGFWKTLKAGYDDFELTRVPPKVSVCSRQYLVNAEFLGHVAQPDPNSTCPRYRRKKIEPFNPFVEGDVTAEAKEARQSRAAGRVASYASEEKNGKSVGNAAPSSGSGADANATGSAGAIPTLASSGPVRRETESTAAQQQAANPPPQQPTAAYAATASEQSSQNQQPGLHNVVKSGKGDMIPGTR